MHIHLAVAELMLLVAVVGCTVPKPSEMPEPDPMVGKLLVASPSMPEPLFRRTVILIVQHDSQGVLGIIVNRPIKEIALSKIEELMGQKDKKVEGSVPVFAGGPVDPKVIFVLHSTDYHRPETIDLDKHVAVTTSPQIFLDIGEKKGPEKRLIAFGYVGWTPEQLESELEKRDWFIEPESPALVFDDDRYGVWEDAIMRLGIDL
jgi:putative transcriptional regulator